MTLDPATIAEWQGWIGRSESATETLDPGALRRFAAAIGEDLDVEHHWPSLGHWAFFLPVVSREQVGEDGHPRRGGFLPPVTLPRRMFAAAEMQFAAPLRVSEPATRRSTIMDVRHRAGTSGELILLDVEHVIMQAGAGCVTERQTIVYRQDGGRTPPILPGAMPDGEGWSPSEADLFRFSAATFNGHRIHYDLDYARSVEGYPALVVHGPYTAAKLFGLAARTDGKPTRFSFRASAPIFQGQPAVLVADAGTYRAVRADGVDGMVAKTIP